jgi:uncharacterized protein YjbI with pentapeptide repeats
LKNANFTEVRAGLPNGRLWDHAGFLPVNFRGADLTGANFTGATLYGADFTGAILTGAVFTDATVDGAIFDDGDLPLSEEQKSVISGAEA